MIKQQVSNEARLLWGSLSPEAILSRAWSPTISVQIDVVKKFPLIFQVYTTYTAILI